MCFVKIVLPKFQLPALKLQEYLQRGYKSGLAVGTYPPGGVCALFVAFDNRLEEAFTSEKGVAP